VIKKAISATVSGRVQHVGFRYFIYQEANALKLDGFVRNLENGNVKIVAQGPADDLDEFMLQVRKGPAWARVDSVKFQELPPGDLTGFKIK